MPYGHGSEKNVEKRATQLARFPVAPESPLLDLRTRHVSTWRTYLAGLWPASVWRPLPDRKAFDEQALAIQASLKGVAEPEMGRKGPPVGDRRGPRADRAHPAHFLGRLKHIASARLVHHRRRDKDVPVLVNVPAKWRDSVSNADLAALRDLAKPLDFASALALAHRLARGEDVGLGLRLAGLLDALRIEVERRFAKPELSDDAVVQLHLDLQFYAGGSSLANIDAALQRGERPSFAIPPAIARGTPIVMPRLAWTPRAATLVAEAAGKPRLASLAVEIAPDHAIVRGILALDAPEPYQPVDEVVLPTGSHSI